MTALEFGRWGSAHSSGITRWSRHTSASTPCSTRKASSSRWLTDLPSHPHPSPIPAPSHPHPIPIVPPPHPHTRTYNPTPLLLVSSLFCSASSPLPLTPPPIASSAPIPPLIPHPSSTIRQERALFQTRVMRLTNPNDELGGTLFLPTPQLVSHQIDRWSPLFPPDAFGAPHGKAVRGPR